MIGVLNRRGSARALATAALALAYTTVAAAAESPPPLVKPTLLISALRLPQEPVAAWGGGPLLALALASDTGSAGASLASASLQFYGWELCDPPPTSAEDAA